MGCSQTRLVYQWPLKYMRVGKGIESGQGTAGTFCILDFSFYEFSYLLSLLPLNTPEAHSSTTESHQLAGNSKSSLPQGKMWTKSQHRSQNAISRGSNLCHVGVLGWMTIENFDCEEERTGGENERGRRKEGERKEGNVYFIHTYCVECHARCFGNIRSLNSQTKSARWYYPHCRDENPEAPAGYSSICRGLVKSQALNPDLPSLPGGCPSHSTHSILKILPLPPL